MTGRVVDPADPAHKIGNKTNGTTQERAIKVHSCEKEEEVLSSDLVDLRKRLWKVKAEIMNIEEKTQQQEQHRQPNTLSNPPREVIHVPICLISLLMTAQMGRRMATLQTS